jgi:hypothetical protein
MQAIVKGGRAILEAQIQPESQWLATTHSAQMVFFID